jgi:hypothetical protein
VMRPPLPLLPPPPRPGAPRGDLLPVEWARPPREADLALWLAAVFEVAELCGDVVPMGRWCPDPPPGIGLER